MYISCNGYIEETNGNKYLIFDDSVNENKELLKICICLGWNQKPNRSNE